MSNQNAQSKKDLQMSLLFLLMTDNFFKEEYEEEGKLEVTQECISFFIQAVLPSKQLLKGLLFHAFEPKN